jgi:hypothetical protein
MGDTKGEVDRKRLSFARNVTEDFEALLVPAKAPCEYCREHHDEESIWNIGY